MSQKIRDKRNGVSRGTKKKRRKGNEEARGVTSPTKKRPSVWQNWTVN